MKPIGVFNLPCSITLVGMLCALFSIYFVFLGNLNYSLIALIWAGIFDLFDGMIARMKPRTEREKSFGTQIDSLVDVLSFGAAPTVILLGFAGLSVWSLIICSLYLFSCVQRLAHFNSFQATEGTINTYIGLPVTYSALILPIFFCASFFIVKEYFIYLSYFIYSLIAMLYIFPIRIPKPRGIVYILMPIIALVFTGIWFFRGTYG